MDGEHAEESGSPAPGPDEQPAPAPAATGRPARKGPSTPALAGVLAVLAAIVAPLVVVCAAGAFGTIQAAVSAQARRTEHEVARLHQRREQESALALTFDGLEAFLLSLHADTRALPEELPELPPDDPWGRPIRYTRLDADRALLESDGPDRRRDTADDVTRPVDAH